MNQDVSDVVVEAVLSYTQTTTLTEAILVLLDTKIKRCANEFCQKEFLFQDQENPGKRKPRNDSQYCSDLCARRTVQRSYVRRKRAKARLTDV